VPDVYTVFVYDLNTNTKITELPAQGVSFDSRHNGAGAISFDVDLQNAKVQVLAMPILQYGGNCFAIYVDRDGIIVWGGIGWTTNYKKSTGLLSIGGNEFRSYFSQRLAAADYSVTTYPAGLDPAVLMYKIFTDAQNPALSGAGSSIGLTVLAGSSSMPVSVPGYPLAQYTYVGTIASDLNKISAPGAGGIDVTITSSWDPITGLPSNTLRIWSPRSGNSAGASGIVFDLASAVDYEFPTDAQSSATTVVVTGSGNGAAMPVATMNAPGVPVGGLGQSPRLDMAQSVSSQSQAQVSLMANALANQYGQALVTPTVTIPTAGAQPLGSWAVGDDARLYTSGDERFPNGYDQYWRIIQQAVTVPNEGVATVTLTFNKPPAI
jgi:hypothetical protein